MCEKSRVVSGNPPNPSGSQNCGASPAVSASDTAGLRQQPPSAPDHELLRCIGRGSYGEVWLARNVLGEFRAIKVIYRRAFEHNRPFEREFEGIRQFEPISRGHPSQLHVGHNAAAGYFYYVMELADDAAEPSGADGRPELENHSGAGRKARRVPSPRVGLLA